MSRCQHRELNAPGIEEAVGADEQRVGALARERGESGLDLVAGAGIEDLNLQRESVRGRLHVLQRGLGARGIGGIEQDGDTRSAGYQLAQQLQPFGHDLADEEIDAGRVAVRLPEAGDDTPFDRIIADAKHNRDRCGDRHGGAHGRGRGAGRGDDGDGVTGELARDLRHAIVSPFEPAVLDRDVLAFDESGFTKTSAESSEIEDGIFECAEADISDHRNRSLLRPRGNRRRRRGAKRGYQFPPSDADHHDHL